MKIDLEAEKVGLSFDNDKSQLLLPKGWTAPNPELLRNIEIRTDVSLSKDMQGMEVVGTPIGSKGFCKRFVNNITK